MLKVFRLDKLFLNRDEALIYPLFDEDDRGRPEMKQVKVPFTGEAVIVSNWPFTRLQMYHVPMDPTPQQRFVTGTLLRVADLLTRVDRDRLRVCPECKRVFVAVRRQRFDTQQCSLRDRVRRFRAGATPRGKKGTKRPRRSASG